VQSFAKYYRVKNILVFDVEPLGCQPFLLTILPHTDADLDQKGCLIHVNALVQKYNQQLKSLVKNWRSQYKTNVVYLSQYDIKIDLMNDAESGKTRSLMDHWYELTSIALPPSDMFFGPCNYLSIYDLILFASKRVVNKEVGQNLWHLLIS
jgi:hypothetical protein